jgi:hypothetical protein
MRPPFEVGATYLIFLDPPYHWRAFERVDRRDDRWLSAVKALVADSSRPSGMMQPLAAYLAEQSAIYVGEIARCFVSRPEILGSLHEVRVREVLVGATRESVLMHFHGLRKCEPGLLVLALVHSVGAYSGLPDADPPGRILSFLPKESTRARELADPLHVDFNQGDSEAFITKDAEPTLARLRVLVQPLRGIGRRPE